jgi:exodeoxyribonuclease V gamma subunit
MVKAGGDPQNTYLLCKDSGWVFAPVRDGSTLLGCLLDFYWEGLTVPLHFFPESALAYCRQIIKNSNETHDALTAARRKWEGNPYRAGWGESDDPYYALCFRHIDPLDETFERLAIRIFEPMLRHCRKISI